MSIEIRIPEVGESITEVVIGEWLKGEADYVEKDEDLVVIESDKATMEIPAPESGQVVKILKQSGETAAVGEIIGRLESSGAKAEEKQTGPVGQNKPAGAAAKQTEHGGMENSRKTVQDDGAEKESRKTEMLTPAVAGTEIHAPDLNAGRTQDDGQPEEETARQDLQKERATSAQPRESNETKRPEPVEVHPGQDGANQAAAQEEGETAGPRDAEPGRKIVARKETVESRQPSEQQGAEFALPRSRGPEREEKPVAMSPIRRRIAERLVQAQQSTAFLSTFNEIDMSGVYAIRRQYQEDFRKKHDIKLGLMSFFVRASIEALKLIPQVNAEIRGPNIVYRNYYDIGVAVGGGKGLVVPVLRNAERMTFGEIERAIQGFALKAEKNQLKPGDLEGGTFTISNGGIYGSLLSTPIINAPQSGVLGMHAIQDRAVVRNGEIVVRPMMYVALTYDHRIIDGREAVTFLKRIKECVEAPSRMLLDV